MSKVLIENKFIQIQKFSLNHITTKYIKWLNDKSINLYSEHRHQKQTKYRVINYFNSRKNNKHYNLLFMALHDKKNKIHFGNMHAYIDKYNKSANLSILIGDKRYFKKGYGSKSWDLCTEYLFKYKKMRIIIAGTMDKNKAMINLMKKSKMNISKEIKNYYMFNNKPAGLIIATKINKKFK